MLQSLGLQRVRHDLATEQQQPPLKTGKEMTDSLLDYKESGTALSLVSVTLFLKPWIYITEVAVQILVTNSSKL